ncbi:MAG: hypothetical protein HQM11_21465, partial [SAR324 cluster bacterium]|nr:hypothetical protein [SAR324 cluster bacterium]
MNKVIAHLDILGFSNHTYTNVEEALELLSDYQTIINQKIIDNKLHPSSSYPSGLQDLAKHNSVARRLSENSHKQCLIGEKFGVENTLVRVAQQFFLSSNHVSKLF